MLATNRCSVQAEKLWAHIRELAMLRATGDGVLHGSRWDELLSISQGAHSDLGHADRLLWIDSMCALQEMAEDDPDTANQLLARLQAAAMDASGDWTHRHRFAPAGLIQRHDSLCHLRRYEEGRERFFGALRGEPGVPTVCRCDNERRIRSEILRQR